MAFCLSGVFPLLPFCCGCLLLILCWACSCNLFLKQPIAKECNCIKKDECPLNNKCLTTNLVYEATLKSTNHNYQPKTYIGISEGTFKTRYANHKKSFNHRKYEMDTTLSKEVWKLKDNNETPTVTWKIKKKCTPLKQNATKCSLCINKKLYILSSNSPNLLNKHNELINKCQHENKFKLKNVTWRNDTIAL